MTDYLQQYKNYYRARAERYKNNPHYSRTYAAASALYQRIEACKRLEELKEVLVSEKENEKVAIALITDEQYCRLKHYQETGQEIKAAACRRIIEKAEKADNLPALLKYTSEESARLNLLITADSIAPIDDFRYAENLEIWEHAEVPENYKDLFAGFAEEERQNIRKTFKVTSEEMNKWVSGWEFDFSLLTKERHRRLLPYPDAEIEAKKELIIKLLKD